MLLWIQSHRSLLDYPPTVTPIYSQQAQRVYSASYLPSILKRHSLTKGPCSKGFQSLLCGVHYPFAVPVHPVHCMSTPRKRLAVPAASEKSGIDYEYPYMIFVKSAMKGVDGYFKLHETSEFHLPNRPSPCCTLIRCG